MQSSARGNVSQINLRAYKKKGRGKVYNREEVYKSNCTFLIMDSLKIDIAKGKQVARILFDRFNSEEGVFGHDIMPEDLLWGLDLSGIKVNKGSYEHLMFITMVVSIDYLRGGRWRLFFMTKMNSFE